MRRDFFAYACAAPIFAFRFWEEPMASSSFVKFGSAVASGALAAGMWAGAAEAAVHPAIGRTYLQPVRGAQMLRRQVKAAAVSTFTTLYSFVGNPDGANPSGELLEDLQGNVYGSTQAGGVAGVGTVYKYANGAVTTLHSFSGPDGSSPAGGLLNSVGNLDLGGNIFGVTTSGGARKRGVIYSVNGSTGAFSILHTFTGGLQGGTPYGRLILFTDGNIYGTTSLGGGYNRGLIFRLTPSGVYSVVACFNGKTGAYPIAGLAASLNGFQIKRSLFGVTSAGGTYGGGSVFALTPQGKIVNIHSFNPAIDGSAPNAELIPNDNGNLYGTATSGGSGNAGTLFEISAAGKFSLLYSFPTDPATMLNPNGSFPFARLATWFNGALYGSTAFGGATGGGVLFKYAGGTFTLLHTFSGSDGATPIGQLLLSPDGNIYGTTADGGAGTYGTLFAMPFTP